MDFKNIYFIVSFIQTVLYFCKFIDSSLLEVCFQRSILVYSLNSGIKNNIFLFSVKSIKPFVLSITEEMFSVSKAMKAYVDEMLLGAE